MNESTCKVSLKELKEFLMLFQPMADADPEFVAYLQGDSGKFWLDVRLSKTKGDRIYFPVHCLKQLSAKVDGSFCVAVPVMPMVILIDSYQLAGKANSDDEITIKIEALPANKFKLTFGTSSKDGTTFDVHDQMEVFSDTPVNTNPMKYRGIIDGLDIQHNKDEWIQIKGPRCMIRFALQTPGDIKEFGEALGVICPGKNVDNFNRGNFFEVITSENIECQKESEKPPMTKVADAPAPASIVVIEETPVTPAPAAPKRRGRPPKNPNAPVVPKTPPAPIPAAPVEPEKPKDEEKVPAPATESPKEEKQHGGRRTAAQKLADDIQNAKELLQGNNYTVTLETKIDNSEVRTVNEAVREKLKDMTNNIFVIASLLDMANDIADKKLEPPPVDLTVVLPTIPKEDLLKELNKRIAE